MGRGGVRRGDRGEDGWRGEGHPTLTLELFIRPSLSPHDLPLSDLLLPIWLPSSRRRLPADFCRLRAAPAGATPAGASPIGAGEDAAGANRTPGGALMLRPNTPLPATSPALLPCARDAASALEEEGPPATVALCSSAAPRSRNSASSASSTNSVVPSRAVTGPTSPHLSLQPAPARVEGRGRQEAARESTARQNGLEPGLERVAWRGIQTRRTRTEQCVELADGALERRRQLLAEQPASHGRGLVQCVPKDGGAPVIDLPHQLGGEGGVAGEGAHLIDRRGLELVERAELRADPVAHHLRRESRGRREKAQREGAEKRAQA